MKKQTKFGLLLAAVAATTFYVVHKLAGKKTVKAPAHVDTTHTTATTSSTPAAPHAPEPDPTSTDPANPTHVSITSDDGHHDGETADGDPLNDQTPPSQWVNTTPKQGTPPTKTLVVTEQDPSSPPGPGDWF